MTSTTQLNVQRRVSVRTGWIGVLRGESLGSATDRTISALNADGYRVIFMVSDRWSVGKHIQNFLIGIVTLGFVVNTPGLLIIGERVTPAGSLT